MYFLRIHPGTGRLIGLPAPESPRSGRRQALQAEGLAALLRPHGNTIGDGTAQHTFQTGLIRRLQRQMGKYSQMQCGERETHNPLISGSSPSGPTILIKFMAL